MKRRWMIVGLGALFLLLMAACTAPPNCDCGEIAVPISDVDWECVSVNEFKGEDIPKDVLDELGGKCESPADAAPAIWLADVCEPNDGFSSDGWMTLSTGDETATLMVGSSMDGPWTAVEANGPAWALSQETIAALVTSQGVAGADDLWFKAGDAGFPQNLGSMIADREAKMDALCAE